MYVLVFIGNSRKIWAVHVYLPMYICMYISRTQAGNPVFCLRSSERPQKVQPRAKKKKSKGKKPPKSQAHCFFSRVEGLRGELVKGWVITSYIYVRTTYVYMYIERLPMWNHTWGEGKEAWTEPTTYIMCRAHIDSQKDMYRLKTRRVQNEAQIVLSSSFHKACRAMERVTSGTASKRVVVRSGHQSPRIVH